MTTLRLIVLLLMTVLLPLRGALATAQPCLGAGNGMAAAAQAAPAEHRGVHGDTHRAEHHAGHHQLQASEQASSTHADPGSHDTGCQASACCLMPLANAPPGTAALQLSNQLRFPALVTPALAFQSGGPDRPPRRG